MKFFYLKSVLSLSIIIASQCYNQTKSTPEEVIQKLFVYSKNGKWKAVKELFSPKCRYSVDSIILKKLFASTDMVTSVSTSVLSQDSVNVEAIIILNCLNFKKVGLYPIKLVFENTRWKILFSSGNMTLALNYENYEIMDEAGINCLLGFKHNENGNYKKAIEFFSKSLQLRSDVIYSYLGLGTTYLKLRNYTKAIEVFNQGAIVNSECPEIYYNLGNAYIYIGRCKEAVKCFLMAIHLKPDFAEAYGGLGIAYRESKQWHLAIKCFNKTIQLQPNCYLGFSNRGYTYWELKMYNKALKDFTKALSLDKTRKDSYVGLAITYYQIGERTKALENYKKAIEIDIRYGGKINKLQDEGIFYSDRQRQTINKILEEIKVPGGG